MLEKLKRKIFWSIELSTVGILFLILLVYNGMNYVQNDREEWNMLTYLLEEETGDPFESNLSGKDDIRRDDEQGTYGKTHNDGPGQSMGRKRGRKNTSRIIRSLVSDKIGLAEISSSGEAGSVTGLLDTYDSNELEQLFSGIRSTGKSQGKIGRIKFMYHKAAYSGSPDLIMVMDSGYINADSLRMIILSLLGLVFAAILFGILARVLTGRIVKPVEATIKNQKQFIADASHELKTPIAVIGANVSVLENELSQNRWLGYIKEENLRMKALISELLQLSRLDYEKDEGTGMEDAIVYDMATVILETALPFESIAYEHEVSYDIQVPDTLPATGHPEDIRQLTGILLDNALKHTPRGGEVKLSVSEKPEGQDGHNRSGIKWIMIEVINSGEAIPPEELPHIFDRFYKSDPSRQHHGRENSFGLGLSIAKALAEKNGGSIRASSANRYTRFTIQFPQKGA